ncbi:hypothetical protein MUK42_26948 [Musa troglodytarum]|uniref:Uncharacterized protein n=1 Tax=Musa troglodytarum TaxID=320322 RepID=A0A9E7G924_9LILI|nr:hypothetical protein MUK42_26948 [Musa troglodytarum]
MVVEAMFAEMLVINGLIKMKEGVIQRSRLVRVAKIEASDMQRKYDSRTRAHAGDNNFMSWKLRQQLPGKDLLSVKAKCLQKKMLRLPLPPDQNQETTMIIKCLVLQEGKKRDTTFHVVISLRDFSIELMIDMIREETDICKEMKSTGLAISQGRCMVAGT